MSVLYFSSNKIYKSGYIQYKYVCCTRCVISKTIKVDLKPTSVLEVSIFHLGYVCFNFKPLPEMLFRKCGCLVAQGKYIFRKLFEVDQENEPLTTEMV